MNLPLDCTVTAMTPAIPGAVTVLQLMGDIDTTLSRLCGTGPWNRGCVRLRRIGDIDECLIVRLNDHVAQIMPHGGPRIRQRMLAWMSDQGLDTDAEQTDPKLLYPEAADDIEARMLRTLSTATSPLAVELLAAQPQRWRTSDNWTEEDDARSSRLMHLLHPPRVVAVGAPNTGKSTLLNALLGRTRVIAHDAPGTTRDWVASHVECAGLVVQWHDTPGRHDTADDIEAEAIALSRRLEAEADLLIAITDADTPWPRLDRTPDLRIGTKADLQTRDDADVSVSALKGTRLDELVQRLRAALVSDDDLASPRPWRFD